MRIKSAAILLISLLASSLAAPLTGVVEDGLSLRSEPIEIRGLTWHDVPADKRYQQTGKVCLNHEDWDDLLNITVISSSLTKERRQTMLHTDTMGIKSRTTKRGRTIPTLDK
ncbi:hypothetical protein H0H93_008544 [Arthromyces matolae]|nr:hypothetical protein H0H93_008544 [Arthromyces matolae]